MNGVARCINVPWGTILVGGNKRSGGLDGPGFVSEVEARGDGHFKGGDEPQTQCRPDLRKCHQGIVPVCRVVLKC